MRLRRNYIDGPVGQVHLRIGGGGRPLYLLHQSPKSGMEMETLGRVLAAARCVVAPDYPGYGFSDPTAQQSAASIPTYAASVWAVADHYGHERVELFGNHTGGMVAAEMARQQPDRVEAIAMISAPILTAQEAADFDAYFQPIPLDRAGVRFTTMWARIQAASAPGVTLEMKARSFLQNLLGGEGYEWGHAAAFAYAEAFAESLAALECPVLVFNPADELAQATRRAGAVLRNGKVVEKPDWGHGLLELKAEALAAEVLAFFAGG
jgi:pimeloyl-ACP methyl ester carboxylesterase